MKTLKEMKDLVQVTFLPDKHLFYLSVRTRVKNYRWILTTDTAYTLWNACRRLEHVNLISYSPNKVLYGFTERSAIDAILFHYNLRFLWEQ